MPLREYWISFEHIEALNTEICVIFSISSSAGVSEDQRCAHSGAVSRSHRHRHSGQEPLLPSRGRAQAAGMPLTVLMAKGTL